jgi:hypothetical protein
MFVFNGPEDQMARGSEQCGIPRDSMISTIRFQWTIMDDSGLNDHKCHKLYLLSISRLWFMIMPVIDSYSTEQYTDLYGEFAHLVALGHLRHELHPICWDQISTCLGLFAQNPSKLDSAPSFQMFYLFISRNCRNQFINLNFEIRSFWHDTQMILLLSRIYCHVGDFDYSSTATFRKTKDHVDLPDKPLVFIC